MEAPIRVRLAGEQCNRNHIVFREMIQMGDRDSRVDAPYLSSLLRETTTQHFVTRHIYL